MNALELQAQKAFRWICSIFIRNIKAHCFSNGDGLAHISKDAFFHHANVFFFLENLMP